MLLLEGSFLLMQLYFRSGTGLNGANSKGSVSIAKT